MLNVLRRKRNSPIIAFLLGAIIFVFIVFGFVLFLFVLIFKVFFVFNLDRTASFWRRRNDRFLDIVEGVFKFFFFHRLRGRHRGSWTGGPD